MVHFSQVILVKNWFYNPSVKFDMWGPSHLLTLLISGFFLLLLFTYRRELISYRRPLRLFIGWLLILSRVSLDIWYVTTDQWSVTSSLPLELCSIASLLCGVMLLTKSRFLFEIFYFIGIGGAIMALVTPDLYFGFPQYRFIQFFLDHTLLIAAPLFLIWLYQYKITRASFWKACISINFIALSVFFINQLLDANYMFLKQKPTAASLLDILGPYPYYLLSLEGIAFIVFLILYIPFKKRIHLSRNGQSK